MKEMPPLVIDASGARTCESAEITMLIKYLGPLMTKGWCAEAVSKYHGHDIQNADLVGTLPSRFACMNGALEAAPFVPPLSGQADDSLFASRLHECKRCV